MPARAFQETHCGASNGVVYLHIRQKRDCVSNTRPNQCGALTPDVITNKIQPDERRALPQHPRQAPSPFRPYAIADQAQRGK